MSLRVDVWSATIEWPGNGRRLADVYLGGTEEFALREAAMHAYYDPEVRGCGMKTPVDLDLAGLKAWARELWEETPAMISVESHIGVEVGS